MLSERATARAKEKKSCCFREIFQTNFFSSFFLCDILQALCEHLTQYQFYAKTKSTNLWFVYLWCFSSASPSIIWFLKCVIHLNLAQKLISRSTCFFSVLSLSSRIKVTTSLSEWKRWIMRTWSKWILNGARYSVCRPKLCVFTCYVYFVVVVVSYPLTRFNSLNNFKNELVRRLTFSRMRTVWICVNVSL